MWKIRWMGLSLVSDNFWRGSLHLANESQCLDPDDFTEELWSILCQMRLTKCQILPKLPVFLMQTVVILWWDWCSFYRLYAFKSSKCFLRFFASTTSSGKIEIRQFLNIKLPFPYTCALNCALSPRIPRHFFGYACDHKLLFCSGLLAFFDGFNNNQVFYFQSWTWNVK